VGIDGIYGNSSETENFNFSARIVPKLKISVKVGTVSILMGIYGNSSETENFKMAIPHFYRKLQIFISFSMYHSTFII
jgi:hypothetical protein